VKLVDERAIEKRHAAEQNPVGHGDRKDGEKDYDPSVENLGSAL